MKDVLLSTIEARYGRDFADALQQAVTIGKVDLESVKAWQVGEAKDHFSEVLDHIGQGRGQMVRRRSEDPVIMMSITQLATFVERAAPKARFADLFGPDSRLPAGRPLTVNESAVGRDDVKI